MQVQSPRPIAVFSLEVGLALAGATLAFRHYSWPILAFPLLASILRPATTSLRLWSLALRLLACLLGALSLATSTENMTALFLLLAFERYASTERIAVALAHEGAALLAIALATLWIGTIGQAYDVFLVTWLSLPRRSHVSGTPIGHTN